MRLRSNNVLRPVDAYVPRRRRTKSPSAQPEETENAADTTLETRSTPEGQSESGPSTQSGAQSKPAPKQKPAKKTGRKKAATKSKKKTGTTADTEADTQTDAQGDALNVIPSVEQPDTRRSTPASPMFKKLRGPPKRRNGPPSKAFRYGSATELFQKRNFPESPLPTPAPPQTPILRYAWPPLSPGKLYDKFTRIPWSLPWTPPPPWKGWPHIFHPPQRPDEPVLTSPEEPASRKRNRVSEDDDSSLAKRHKLVLQTPTRMGNRPRGSPRRTYADRARRREAERNGRIDRTIYRVPQFLAQQGEDQRSGYSTPSAPHAVEETTVPNDSIVPISALPSAQSPTQTQHSWGRWIFDSVTRLWQRGNVPQAGDATAAIGTQPATESEPHITTPFSAPPSSAVSRNLESPTPRSRIEEPQTTKRKKYTYDLDPRGFDPELLARMRARSSKPAHRTVPAPPEQIQAHEENESKKRKRQASPDVIPHPPGCSYGFDPDYFIYDDDEEEEDQRTAEEQSRQETVTKEVAVSDGRDQKQEHVPKRVRTGKIPPENFNYQGHFQTPGWSSSSSDDSPQHDPQPPPVASPPKPKPTPPTPQTEAGPLRFARKMAELYKPKTPSRLRAAHRYSSSPCLSYEENLRMEEALRRRRIGPYPRTFAKACPSGNLNHIIWPEPELWISRLAFSENLETFTKSMAKRYCYKSSTNGTHELFMDRLAEMRAARAAKKRAAKSAKIAQKCALAH